MSALVIGLWTSITIGVRRAAAVQTGQEPERERRTRLRRRHGLAGRERQRIEHTARHPPDRTILQARKDQGGLLVIRQTYSKLKSGMICRARQRQYG